MTTTQRATSTAVPLIRLSFSIVIAFITWLIAFSAYFIHQLGSSAFLPSAYAPFIVGVYTLGMAGTATAITWSQPASNKLLPVLWIPGTALIAAAGMYLLDDAYQTASITFEPAVSEGLTAWGFRLGYGLLAALMLSRWNILIPFRPPERRFGLRMVIIATAVWVGLSFLTTQLAPVIAEVFMRDAIRSAADAHMNQVIKAAVYALFYGSGMTVAFSFMLSRGGHLRAQTKPDQRAA